jgi:transposase
MTKSSEKSVVTGGVDTHKDTHAAAALDSNGRLLGVSEFPATAVGHRRLQRWLEGFGQVTCIGVEGTGSYGAGFTRHLSAEGLQVLEVSCPNRQLRRRRGKSDPVDAEAAARAALSGQALGTPKSQDGPVEGMRLVRVERRSRRAHRPQTGCTAQSLQLLNRCGSGSTARLYERSSSWRPRFESPSRAPPWMRLSATCCAAWHAGG